MNNKQKSIRNLLYAALSQVVLISISLLLPRLFVTSYGSEVNGLLNSLGNFLMCLNLFEAGVDAATLQALYRPTAESDWTSINGVLAATNKYYQKTARWYFICLVALALVYPLMVDGALSNFTIFGCVFFSGFSNVLSFYLSGKYRLLLKAEGKNYVLSNLDMILTLLVSLTKILLIYLKVDIVLILAISFAYDSLYNLYILLYVRKHFPLLNINSEPKFEAISQKSFALVHRIGELVFQNTDVIVITMFCGLKLVSVYGMFKLITGHLDQILAIIVDSINFLLGQTYQTDLVRYQKMIDLFDSAYGGLAYALYAVALYLFLPFMRVYTAGVTDINYVDGKLAILFVITSLMSQSRVGMSVTVNYAGHFKQTMGRSMAETAINLIVSIAAVYAWGIYGVLLGTVVALLYRTNDFIIYANTKCLNRKPWRTYGIYLVNVLTLLLTTVVFDKLFGWVVIDSFVKLLIVAVPITLLSVLMFAAAQILCFRHCRDALASVIHRKK